MSSNFPNGPDTITNNVDNTTPEFNIHPPLHNQLADSIMAVQVSLLAGGSLSLADHTAATNPHPVYLTQAEGDARYALIGGGLTIPLTQNLTFSPDNTYDIGASGANRPRHYYGGGNVIVGGNIQTTGGTIYAASTIAWGTFDLSLVRDAANTLAQRNGTSPQTLRIYNTYTDANNYERLSLNAGAGLSEITTQNLGTGTGRNLYVSGAAALLLGGYGAYSWQIVPHLWAVTDNAYDIGASGASRPRNIYAAGGIYTAMNTAAQGPAMYGGSGVPAAGFGANGDVFHRSDTPATSLQRIYVKSAGAWVGIV